MAPDVTRGLDRGQSTLSIADHVKNHVLYPKSNWFQTEISESDSMGLFDSKSSKEKKLKRDKNTWCKSIRKMIVAWTGAVEMERYRHEEMGQKFS